MRLDSLILLFLSFPLAAQVPDSLLYKNGSYFNIGYLRSYYSQGDIIIKELPSNMTPQGAVPNGMVYDTVNRISKLEGFNIGYGLMLNCKKVTFNPKVDYRYQSFYRIHIKPINPNLLRTESSMHIISPGISMLYRYHRLAFSAGLKADITAKARISRVYNNYTQVDYARESYSFFQYEFGALIPLIRRENHRTFLNLSVLTNSDILKRRTGYAIFYAAGIQTELFNIFKN
jgi:hypothetical protein